jgi:hypothetical protein
MLQNRAMNDHSGSVHHAPSSVFNLVGPYNDFEESDKGLLLRQPRSTESLASQVTMRMQVDHTCKKVDGSNVRDTPVAPRQ